MKIYQALRGVLVALPGVLLLVAAPANGQTAENVAVIINEASDASRRVGEHYARVRKLPAPNVIRITCSEQEEIDYPEYQRSIQTPVGNAIAKGGLQDRILYLVLTKGIPLRIRGTDGRAGTQASVDSELTLLYRRMTGIAVTLPGAIDNPYFLGDQPLEAAGQFTHRRHDVYLVTRLDGFTVEDAIAVVDRAQTPAASGRFVLDQAATGNLADGWLAEAAGRLKQLGHGDRVLLENTTRAARDVTDVIGYFSWGSNDPENRVRRMEMGFAPGALAAMFVSTDARTFVAPPDDWIPPRETMNRKFWFAGAPQSLAGDLIREGITGLAGNVAEPYLDSATRPEILFPAYVSGFNLAEAFYLALPHLGWQTIIIGDPLCAPFRKSVLTAQDVEDPPDPGTLLPGIFSSRRVQTAQRTMKNVPGEAVTLTIRAETLLQRGDEAEARQALERVTEIAPDAASAQMGLAILYQQGKDHSAAVERYRRVIALQPDNVVALNNLAYSLAVDLNEPEEALPLARRAVSLAPKNITVVDTLAWIEHLLGNSRTAADLLGALVERGTASAEIHLHAAFIFAAVPANARALAQLDQALRLDPALGSRDDVKKLRQQLVEK